MSGETEVLFSLAGRIHVLLRRESNRIIDVEWMFSDALYAKEVVRLARTATSQELQELAERVEEVHPLLPRIKREAPMPQAPPYIPEMKYVASLR